LHYKMTQIQLNSPSLPPRGRRADKKAKVISPHTIYCMAIISSLRYAVIILAFSNKNI
jgi:hypothetical protein